MTQFTQNRLKKKSVSAATRAVQTRRPPAENVNPRQVLLTLIENLNQEMGRLRGRSKEGCVNATLDALELWHKQNPPSNSDLVDLALKIPGFTAEEFARQLREKLEK